MRPSVIRVVSTRFGRADRAAGIGREGFMRETPLYREHRALSGKIVDFNGWALPIQFSGIVAEHEHTRTKVSLFDCSHMGEFHIVGDDAIARYHRTVISDVHSIAVGRCRLGALLNEEGGIVDDLITVRLAEDELYVVNNAGPLDRVVDALTSDNPGARNVSYETAKLDVQGPGARDIVLAAGFDDAASLNYFNARWTEWKGHKILISRTGYTGEVGYELFVPNEIASELWKVFLAMDEVEAAGLGARDTLRTEVGYNLSGQDFDGATLPWEANMEAFVAWDTDFIGKAALLDKRGTEYRVLVAIRSSDRRAPRHDFDVYSGDDVVGRVTSGTYGPSVGCGVGLARVDPSVSESGTRLCAGPRRMEIEVTDTPIYKKGTCRKKF